MSVGERIRARRKELGMSAETLAAKLGCHSTTVYRYESGYIEKLDAGKLIPIAEALNVTPGYLMGWEEGNEEGGDEAPEPAHSSETWKLISAGCSNLSEEKLNRIYDVLKAVFPEDFKEGGKDK